MIIHSFLQIGTHHSNHCEDFLIVEQCGQTQWLLAVMDGCSMGKDSYFASTLIGKLLRKIAKLLYFKEFAEQKTLDNATLLKKICHDLFFELKFIKQHLHLDKYETLATVILAIVETNHWNIDAIVVGDGVLVADTQIIDFQQNNRPDYLGYHLDSDFESWYAQQRQVATFSNVSDFSISSDGIFTFARFDDRKQIYKKDIVYELLIDDTLILDANMFKIKLRNLELQAGLKPTDDLGIIRIVRKT
jgi:hypothetical protein